MCIYFQAENYVLELGFSRVLLLGRPQFGQPEAFSKIPQPQLQT